MPTTPTDTLRTTGPSSPPFLLYAGLDGLDLAQRFRHRSSRHSVGVTEEILGLLRAAGIGAHPSSRAKRHRTRGLSLDGFELTVVPLRGRDYELIYTVEAEALHATPRKTYATVETVNRRILAALSPEPQPGLWIVGLTIHVDAGGVALAAEDMGRFFLRGSGNRRAYEHDGRKGAFTGFTFRNPGWLRVYWKTELIRRKPRTRWMLDYYGGYTGEVWRVEAKFGRAQLRRVGRGDLAELFRRRLRVLTLRAPLTPGARPRSDRRTLDPFWTLAREAPVVFPWDASAAPSLPALRPHSDAARLAQADSAYATGLALRLDSERTPPETLTLDALPEEAARHVREFVTREPERARDLIRRFADRTRRLRGGDDGAAAEPG